MPEHYMLVDVTEPLRPRIVGEKWAVMHSIPVENLREVPQRLWKEYLEHTAKIEALQKEMVRDCRRVRLAIVGETVVTETVA